MGGDLLLVATDRLSAFDVVLPTPIPDKGRVLTQLSLFWFDTLRDVDSKSHPQRNGVSSRNSRRIVSSSKAAPCFAGARIRCRSSASCAATSSGSGWKDYRATGKVCGIALPPGLRESDRLPEPIFTPSTKATTGHDENISFDEAVKRIGAELAEQVRAVSLEIYRRAAAYAEPRGIILADTKFEFGLHRRRTDLD